MKLLLDFQLTSIYIANKSEDCGAAILTLAIDHLSIFIYRNLSTKIYRRRVGSRQLLNEINNPQNRKADYEDQTVRWPRGFLRAGFDRDGFTRPNSQSH
jgi:hypothetical protein